MLLFITRFYWTDFKDKFMFPIKLVLITFTRIECLNQGEFNNSINSMNKHKCHSEFSFQFFFFAFVVLEICVRELNGKI